MLPTTTTTTTAPAGSTPGPTELVVGIADHGAPRTLNPFLDGPDTGVLDLLGPAVLATGYDIDPATNEPVPDVLAEIPSVANGGIVVNDNGTMDVTVRVDPAATWADGTPMSGADLAFTIATVTDPSLPIRSDLRDRYAGIVAGSVRATGSQVTFRMKIDADVWLLFDVVLPAHEVGGGDFATDWDRELWVSGGPYVVADYQEGQYLVLERNDRYWKSDPSTGDALPSIDRLVVRFFEPGTTPDPRLLRAFETRDLDVVLTSFGAETRAGYEALASDGARITSLPGPAWEQINFQFGPSNRNPESLNRHLEYRRAVAHAIDRDRLAPQRGTTPLFSALARYAPALGSGAWERYDYDPQETASLLYSLGEDIGSDLFAGSGPRLVLTASGDSPATVALAGEVVVMLDEAGIGAELQLEGPSLFFGQTLDSGTWDVAAWKFAATPGRAGAVAFVEMFDPDGLPFVGDNFLRWGTVDSTVKDEATARYAEIVDELRRTIDPDEIDRLVAEAEELLAEQVVLLPLVVHEESGAVVWTDRVEGVGANPYQSELWDVETWRVPAG
ncbi:MAG: hypothetical protein KQH83_08785 [Actinobacteria bacterium]|nr:hypothetical protein [Actinomycetota bacterium]